MNGNADRTAGLGTADTSSATDHPQRPWRSAVHDAKTALQDALRILECSTRQEVQAARIVIGEAIGHLEEAFETRQG